MSLILDALNRSDSDRNSPESVPGLQSVHGPRGGDGTPFSRRYLWPGLTLIFALLALGLWVGSGQDEDSKDAAPPVEERIAEDATAARAAEVTPPPSVVTGPAPQAALETETETEPEPVSDPVTVQVTKPADPALEADIAALYQQEPEAVEQQAPAKVEAVEQQAPPVPEKPAEPALDIDDLTRAAQAELDDSSVRDAPLVEHEAPFITDLRQSIKDQIPSIFYSEHSWASNPAERSVVLNRQRYTEGQQVKPGLRLLEILPDSIVLNFQGTEFRLQSMNSWVNL